VATFRVPVPRPWSRRLGALIPVFVVSLSLGGALAGCSSDGAAAPTTVAAPATTAAPPATTAAPPAAVPTVPMGAMTMPTADEVAAAWGARPAYVRALPDAGQAAYAYALARPDVLQWLPCYCGCGGMGHGSNLDCFFARREEQGTFTYEEHGSYCNICVETATLASDMLRQGSTITQVRAAVDSTFGGGAVPGTDTPLPPSS